MIKIVRKSYLKKLLVIASLVISGFVYAHGNPDNGFTRQVKIIKCYPNPAVSVINFDISEIDKGYSLQIYTFTGKKMTDLPVNASKISVTLDNDFYRGIYIYQLHDKTGKLVETGKFQVVK